MNWKKEREWVREILKKIQRNLQTRTRTNYETRERTFLSCVIHMADVFFFLLLLFIILNIICKGYGGTNII